MSKRYIKKQQLNKQQKFGRKNKEVNPDSYNPLLQRSASLPTLSKRMQLAPRNSKSLSDLTKVIGQDSTLLNAKSEVSLKTIAVRNTPAFGQSLRVLRDLANRRMQRSSIDTSISSFGQSSQSNSPKEGVVGLFDAVRVPIVGYEVMEERARFTIFKLRIENKVSNTSWLVLRRYTDFMRLYGKLKALFPGHDLPTFPRKKWFGNNFSSTFLDNRISGLQSFINQVIADDELKKAAVVREFFCLDEAPTYSESMEECRVCKE
jgi:sorting nexin-16